MSITSEQLNKATAAWIEFKVDADHPDSFVVHTPYVFADCDGLVILLKYNEDFGGWYYSDEGHTFFHFSIAYDSFSTTANKPRTVMPDVPMWETISRRYQITDIGLTEQGKAGDIADWIKYGVSVSRYPSGDNRVVGELIRKIEIDVSADAMDEFSDALSDFIQGLLHIIFAVETREYFREQGADV